MAENTLGAFVVKRKKILLPALNNRKSNSNNTFWKFSIERSIVHREILIEAKEETVCGYNLYGTEIPVIFSHPTHWYSTEPTMEPCVGVETEQWEVSKYMKINHPNGTFQYQGKYITDEEVIAWLEKEDNIKSMRKVKEWALQYGEECNRWRLEEEPKIEAIRQREAEENAQKVKKMIARRDELVSKY